METAIRDLLPAEVDLLVQGSNAASGALPSEILEFQAEQLKKRTNGFLTAQIFRKNSDDKEIVLSFELEAVSLDYTATLFQVRHRPNFEYPALIVPPEPLPAFLQPTVTVTKVKKGVLGSSGHTIAGKRAFDVEEELVEQNHWLAITPHEFEDKIGEVLRSPQVRSVFQNLSMLSRRLSAEPKPNEPTESSAE